MNLTTIQRFGVCIALGIAIAASARINPLGSGDQQIYARVARDMKHGQSYYASTVHELPTPPAQLRDIREPTSAWILRVVPERLWGLLDALAWGAALFFASRLSRRPLLVIVLGGAWLFIRARWGIGLFAEIYGLPFALYGLHEARQGNDDRAAVSFLAAACFRELYAVGLLIGLARRRWPWFAATVAFAAVYLAHSIAAHPYLAPKGYELPFGAPGYHFNAISTAIGPQYGRFGMACALALLVGFLARARRDWFTSAFVLVLFALSAWSLRYYWQVMWVLPMLAVAFGPRDRMQRDTVGAETERRTALV